MVLRLLIAEDLDLVAEAFEALLATEPGLTVVARVGRGEDVVPAALQHQPDIALLDIVMPGGTGIEACEALREALPSCKVLLLTSLPRSGHLGTALAAGASGYLVKTLSARELVAAIHTVARGGIALDPTVAAEALMTGPSPLTTRERDVLRLVDQGVPTHQIAEELFLSPGTVRNYLSNCMSKLDASTRVEAARLARSRGLI
ncbi:response regulator [Knoellia sp. CPCC 206450]|uniref:response regulator n=1 Tax=Knoellia tibetensis TaxID=3404798 RepID=UPI003B431BD5